MHTLKLTNQQLSLLQVVLDQAEADHERFKDEEEMDQGLFNIRTCQRLLMEQAIPFPSWKDATMEILPWHFVTSKGTVTLYYNGARVGEPMNWVFYETLANFIWHLSREGVAHSGPLAFYDQVLTPEEIQRHFIEEF